jgi:arylsulfatase A-like enzyme
LFAHYPCTHAPYIAHPEHDFGSRDVDVYDSALAHCDEQVGRLLHAIDARADADRTVVAVLSDHGEMFGEHGQTQHGSSMIEAAMRSVLLLRVPGRPGGATVDAPVLLSDLHATLLRYASAPAPGPPQWDLGAYLGHEPDPTTSDRLLFLYVDTWRRGVHFEARGVVDGRYKLVRDLSAGTEQLFDLDADPGEVHNARWRLRAEASKLRTALDSWNPTDAVR